MITQVTDDIWIDLDEIVYLEISPKTEDNEPYAVLMLRGGNEYHREFISIECAKAIAEKLYPRNL